jgi:hypothetical protein
MVAISVHFIVIPLPRLTSPLSDKSGSLGMVKTRRLASVNIVFACGLLSGGSSSSCRQFYEWFIAVLCPPCSLPALHYPPIQPTHICSHGQLRILRLSGRIYYQMIQTHIDAENELSNMRVIWLLIGEAQVAKNYLISILGGPWKA